MNTETKSSINILPVDRSLGRKNEYVIYEDYAEIIIRKKDGTVKAKAIIDIDDVPKCEPYRWNIFEAKNGAGNKNDYVRCSVKPGQNLMLHRLIVSCPEGKVVDHINHNKLDNRKTNLRVVTQARNTANNTKGSAYFDKKSKKWFAMATRYGHRYYTHAFDTKEEALNDRARIIAWLNENDEQLQAEFKSIDNNKVTGVRYYYGKWLAYYSRDYKNYTIGRYNTKDEAIKAREETLAKIKLSS